MRAATRRSCGAFSANNAIHANRRPPRRRRELRRDQATSTGSRPVRTLLGELIAVRPAGQSSGRERDIRRTAPAPKSTLVWPPDSRTTREDGTLAGVRVAVVEEHEI